ncbi:hypothetical protein [Micromonospora sp. WMMD1082]|uniref:hypothetical protein n=1 Tax=Micromonospora sp. WMMD1082 TaxID=3016104 RepID=UPI0024162C01|nr:hypothetical protein [Micromonospora sp. WMMD1082]MDG4796324.1 hypothetical protein [Micromonospora sp. WMMD1082]
MADNNTLDAQAEYFLDLDDLDLAGVDVDVWDKTAGGTTAACVIRTITVVTRAVCGSIDCSAPPPGGSY